MINARCGQARSFPSQKFPYATRHEAFLELSSMFIMLRSRSKSLSPLSPAGKSCSHPLKTAFNLLSDTSPLWDTRLSATSCRRLFNKLWERRTVFGSSAPALLHRISVAEELVFIPAVVSACGSSAKVIVCVRSRLTI